MSAFADFFARLCIVLALSVPLACVAAWVIALTWVGIRAMLRGR